ncbi:sigma factor [Umezawaea tangerina]|uniref:Sigma-70-like protein n=1 Tax=Umezawaea tangerina TaxID=84725 RepID=A0A2T0SP23_9PSEU|nr:sigma factor [Umezawaea tangerina]PRY35162.1 sigma-70-like protein [Umezawaea tangerina]
MLFRSTRAEVVAGELLVRRLYQEHGRALLAYATRLTGDPRIAEDVAEETLVRAWRYSEAITTGGDWVRGWLLDTAENVVCEMSARRARPRPEPARLPTAVRSAVRRFKVNRMNAVRTSEAPLTTSH